MSYWTISPEMQIPASRSNSTKKSLLMGLLLPFTLAVMGIPLYLMLILKLIGLMV